MKKVMRWTVILMVMAMVWTAVSQQDTVQALRDGSHTVAVLARADAEITPKSAAGQYYHDLLWKHNSEMGNILLHQHPEHRMQFVTMIDSLIPSLEAFLDSKGDSATISAEQIDALQNELDWLKSIGSDSLRADIACEEVRFPLAQFIGMNVNEAYNTVVTGFGE